MQNIILFLILILVFLKLTKLKNQNVVEHLSSDWNNSFWGVQVWNGWPY